MTSNNQKVFRGLFLTKKALIILILVLVCIYVATVLGLTLGLRDRWYNKSTDSDDVEHDSQRTTTQSPTATTPIPKINVRLPKSLTPYYYDVKIDTRFNSSTKPETFTGDVQIDVNCVTATDTIVLHIENITVFNESIWVKGVTQVDFEVRNITWSHDAKTDFLKLELTKVLTENHNYSIYLKYKAIFNDKSNGLYRRSYQDYQNKTRWIVASQMESMNARKVFPCFDEPALRAKFKFSIVHHKDFSAASNMPSTSRNVVDNDYFQTDFEPTSIKMSTYLVGIFITDFQCKPDVASAGLNNALDLKACARSNVINKVDFSLRATVKIIEYLQRLFGIPYQLPKLDSYAIPKDGDNAMENYGIVRYGESLFLYDDKTTQYYEESIVQVIAHELGHKWIGNLVTINWWSDLWVKEGVVTYFEYLATDFYNVAYEIFDEMLLYAFDTMQTDGLLSSHPVSMDYDATGGIYDDITYLKGGAIIKMMNFFLGSQTFMNGMKNYLKNNSYGAVLQESLWPYFDEQARLDGRLNETTVGDIMTTWTKQKGFPVVTVKRVDANRIEVTQEQFVLYHEHGEEEEAKRSSNGNHSAKLKWYVPFTFAQQQVTKQAQTTIRYNTNDLYKQVIWLQPNEESKILNTQSVLTNSTFILANLDASGFYRVNYELSNWDLIIEQLRANRDIIPTRSRGQLINDAFTFAQSGILDVIRPLELVRYLSNETKYLPWRTLSKSLPYMINMLESTRLFGPLQDYLIKVAKPVYDRLGWSDNQNEAWTNRKLRATVLEFACALDQVDCVTQAKTLFDGWMNSRNRNTNTIPSNFRSFVYCTAIRHGTIKQWEFLNQQFTLETEDTHKETIHNALACSKEAWILEKYLNDQLSGENCMQGIQPAIRRHYGSLITWGFVKDNYNVLVEKCGGKSSVAGLIDSIANKFNRKYQLEDLKDFTKRVDNDEVDVDDKINANINWLENNFELLKSKLPELAYIK